MNYYLLKSFLDTKMQQEKLSRKELAEKCGITYSSIGNFLTNPNLVPSIDVILRIANSFKVNISAIVGLEEEKTIKSTITNSEAQRNLKQYIKERIQTEQIKPRYLSRSLGFNDGHISEFIGVPQKKQSLGTNIVLALSKYWRVSIDEMIGRTAPAQSLAQEKEAETNIPREIKDKLNPRGEKELEDIKAALKGVAASNARSTPTTTPPMKKVKKKEGVGIEG